MEIFFKDMLIALGFQDLWISWIMGCVTFVSYSVLINGPGSLVD